MKKLIFLCSALALSCSHQPDVRVPASDEREKPAGYNNPSGYNNQGYTNPGYTNPGYNNNPGQGGWQRPGDNRPGDNRPGGNRPGDNRPGDNRPGGPGGNQPPRTSIIGEIERVTPEGVVYGWGCDTNSRAALRLRVYINGARTNDIDTMGAAFLEANLNIRDRGNEPMGLPARECGENSGFKFQLPKRIMTGLNIELAVRGLERNDAEAPIGRVVTFQTSTQVTEPGIFQVGEISYDSNGTSFCMIVGRDQLNLLQKARGGMRPVKRLDRLPGGMNSTGNCEMIRYPKGIFNATKDPANSHVYYHSNGVSYCAIPFPGMTGQIKDKEKIRELTSYDVPPTGFMQMRGICKVEGEFSVGGEVYYSNGTDAFCHRRQGQAKYTYEALPPEQANHGQCR